MSKRNRYKTHQTFKPKRLRKEQREQYKPYTFKSMITDYKDIYKGNKETINHILFSTIRMVIAIGIIVLLSLRFGFI